MKNFIIRIELHDASNEDYDRLHQALREVDILQTIQDGETKEEYYLPRGLYHYEGYIMDKKEMHDKVVNITEKIIDDFEVVVILSQGSFSSGLTPLKK